MVPIKISGIWLKRVYQKNIGLSISQLSSTELLFEMLIYFSPLMSFLENLQIVLFLLSLIFFFSYD